jgi:hypothetical protein
MAEQVPAVCDVLSTIERRDWTRLEQLLDPRPHLRSTRCGMG